MTARVFVSYRRDDSKHAAGRLGERLDERFTLFMDVDRIRPGADFPTVVREAVDQTDVLLAIIGSSWLTLKAENGGRRIDQPGDWVAEEVGTALRLGTPVIPVLVDGAEMPSRSELPPALAELANRQAMKIAHESFAADCARLLKTIEGLLGAQKHEVVNLWEDPDYPRARGAFLQGLWPAAIEGFERVLRRHPRQPRVLEQLEQARANQRRLDLEAAAWAAEQAGRWEDAVYALEAIVALQPSDRVTERLAQARLKVRVTELQRDVRGFAAAGNWAAAAAADAELVALDPRSGDPDGLATKARTRLTETERAAAYAHGVQQLDAEDWAGAEATFTALIQKWPDYSDAEGLLGLARRQGKPVEESAPPPIRKPEPKPAPTRPPPAPSILTTPVVKPQQPTSLRRQGIVVGVAITAVLAIIIVIGVYNTREDIPTSGGTIPAYTPTPTASESTTPGWTDAQYKLFNLVPSGFADSCEPLVAIGTRLKPNVVAAIRCDPGPSGTPDYVDYYRYPSKAATEAAFKRYTDDAATAGCDGNSSKWHYTSTPETTQGQLTCFERGTSRLIVWDDVKAHIVYRAGSQKMTETQERAWWKKGASW